MPELSVVVVPVPSLNAYAATSPGAGTAGAAAGNEIAARMPISAVRIHAMRRGRSCAEPVTMER